MGIIQSILILTVFLYEQVSSVWKTIAKIIHPQTNFLID